MGFDYDGIKFLTACRDSGVDFTDVLTIGRQDMCVNNADHLAEAAGIDRGQAGALLEQGGDCSPFLQMLGAQHVESLDASAYEGASVLWDLNLPVPEEWKNRYSVVIDAGSLEHVFNYPEALRSCMGMVRDGGYLLFMTPANTFFGHGFYQFSSELFYRALSEDNGFAIEQMVVHIPGGAWLSVPDARSVRGRVLITNGNWTNLMVRARRVALRPIFASFPQQSDYEDEWKGDKWNTNALWLNP